jgi:putative N6-adenine-specific DNA methylase
LSAQRQIILVSCAKGVAPHLSEELHALGFPVLGEQHAGVETEGTLEDTQRLNLHIRTGQRVLYQLAEFEVRNADMLYSRMTELPWENWIAPDGYIRVATAVQHPTIRDSRFATLKAKDAIVDHIRRVCNRRPDSGSERDRTVVFVYWHESLCRVYLDTSGEAISRRGYRHQAVEAPMQEALAAAVVKAAGWTGSGLFVNPMCGSGTLAIEAALIACNRAPGILRKNFGFMHIRGYSSGVWDRLREAARQAEIRRPACRIVASDKDPHAVDTARQNARNAGVDHLIEFHVCDFAETPIPDADGGIVLMNPEYGERMGDAIELEATYRRIGDFFKQQCQGRTGFVFTGNLPLGKMIGLRSSRRMTFFNGEIECRLLRFDVYSGTRRKFGANDQPGLEPTTGTQAADASTASPLRQDG